MTSQHSGLAPTSALKAFLAARDFLLKHREEYETARREFRWPELSEFNWALDYFDNYAHGNSSALWIVNDDATEVKVSFAEMSRRSNQVANFLRRHGVKRGDRMIVMLPNVVAIWEVMLAAMKLGAIVVPAATLLTRADLSDRLERGKARHVIATSANVERFSTLPGEYTRIAVGEPTEDWISYDDAYNESPEFRPGAPTRATDPFLLYFTSGTTALAKLVLHAHQSYPVGHLATMYWIGIRPDDVHLNISSPGWAKHAWSCFFAPWNAGATVSTTTPALTLRDRARTTLQLGLDRVIPLGQSFVGLQSKGSNLIRGGLETAGIVAAVEISGDLKSSLGSGGAGIVEDLLVGIQGFACPVSRDLGEEAMLDGIPFGSAGGIVGHGYGQGKRVGELGLELSFPSVTAATVAAAGIGQDEQLA